MKADAFIGLLRTYGIEFFTGVPDSQLKGLCDYLIDTYGISNKHIIAANEGNAVALAAGYHLSTGKTPCVYLQNSGLGNIINPVASLLNEKIYGLPTVFIIGWRGEPNVHDEPQHIFQGRITIELLKLLEVDHYILDINTTEKEIANRMKRFKKMLDSGKSAAFLVRKGALSYIEKVVYKNNYLCSREDYIRVIADVAKESIIVSTTGKASRELFEIRETNGQSHKHDFLTVGSMGHSSSIALGIALNKPNTMVWCLDGDGAALMHMGAMALIGATSPANFIHIIINNGAHESVGGQPTVAVSLDLRKIADGCGYKRTYVAESIEELKAILSQLENKKGPVFIEVKAAISSRDNLGRPAETPIKNKTSLMEYLRECE